MALLSVAEALERVLAKAAPLPAEEAPLAEAAGRVLAFGLKARRTQPPADVSAMDGYAVRAADVANTPVRLKIIGEVAAGRPFARALGSGEAARIFTGGVLPRGADTIVQYLVAHGAKMDAKTSRGFTALDVAMGKDQFGLPVPHDTTVALLRSLGGSESSSR